MKITDVEKTVVELDPDDRHKLFLILDTHNGPPMDGDLFKFYYKLLNAMKRRRKDVKEQPDGSD